MFSAISYQLQTSNIGSSELRQMAASHLEANVASYLDFVCQPVADENAYNADTEKPTAEDQYIDSVADSKMRTQLRWEKYVRCLRQGAWGDHITLQAIADRLSVKITVLSSDHPASSVTPSSCKAVYEIFVGLITRQDV